MKLILPPRAAANEASTMGYTARMRQRLIELNNARVTEPDFMQWHKGYFIPLLTEINVRWGEASIVSRTGNFSGNTPPWFDADTTAWSGGEILFPQGLHVGARVSFSFRLYNKMSFANETEEKVFGQAMARIKRDAENDIYWDDEIIWPL